MFEILSLTKWLREYHNISYKTYRRKPKAKRILLKQEYEQYVLNESAWDDLRECGVPFDEWGDPIGI